MRIPAVPVMDLPVLSLPAIPTMERTIILKPLPVLHPVPTPNASTHNLLENKEDKIGLKKI
jgi:hypothetical protein